MAVAGTVQEGLEIIAHRAADALDVSSCIVYEYEAWTDAILARAAFERTPTGWNGLNEPFPVGPDRSPWHSLLNGEAVHERISDPGLTTASRALMERWGHKTCFTVPLVVRSCLVGALGFYDREEERSFDGEELSLIDSLAAIAGQAIHSAQLLRQMEERHTRLVSLLEAARAITSSLDVDEVLKTVGEHAMAALGCDACEMIPGEQREGRHKAVLWTADENQVVQQRCEDPRLSPEVKADMLGRHQRSRLVVPIPFGNSRLGTMVLSDSTKDRFFSEVDIDLARGLAEQAALAINNARRHKELRDVQLAGLINLVGALGAKEPYTQGHAARVAHYVTLIGTRLGWSDELIGRAEEAAIMHDVGKLAVSDSVLLKPGPLSDAEWKVMRTHPETSEEILRRMMPEDMLRAIRGHHERYDGGGYPDGLRGKEIPLVARAICVADCYDAMSFRRPYRRPLSYRECRGQLMQGRGSQFDPLMVDAMLAVLDDLEQRRDYCHGPPAPAPRRRGAGGGPPHPHPPPRRPPPARGRAAWAASAAGVGGGAYAAAPRQVLQRPAVGVSQIAQPSGEPRVEVGYVLGRFHIWDIIPNMGFLNRPKQKAPDRSGAFARSSRWSASD
jgi:HD-GYP domain-containing protein (c-di-GMP phosphodiesterase class II)